MIKAADPFLSIRELRSSFGGPFHMGLGRGECVSILGKSGSGKSVFLRLIADLDAGTGAVHLEGRSRDSWPAPEWRRRVVYQAAEPAWWAPTAAAHFSARDAASMEELLPALGLSLDLLGVDIARLSTGERQRLALVRSLAAAPSVLLLDEPTASLDRESTCAMEALLRGKLEAGMAIIMVTHSLDQAERMSRRSLEMVDGTLHPP